MQRPDLTRSLRIGQQLEHIRALRTNRYTISRGLSRSRSTEYRLKLVLDSDLIILDERRKLTSHATMFALYFQKFPKSHGGTMPNLPRNTEQVDFQHFDQAIPYPATRSNIQRFGLLYFFRRYCTTFRWVNDNFLCPCRAIEPRSRGL